MWQIILTAIAVSIDGFWGGFAFGLKKTRIPLASLLIISSWSILCSGITMFFGQYITRFIPLSSAKLIGALLLLGIGAMAIREGLEHSRNPLKDVQFQGKPQFTIRTLFRIIRNPTLADYDQNNNITPSEGTLLGLAVAMDASIAAFALAINGVNPFTTPIIFGFSHFALIGLGNICAQQQLFFQIGNRFALLPGAILIILAILRLV